MTAMSWRQPHGRGHSLPGRGQHPAEQTWAKGQPKLCLHRAVETGKEMKLLGKGGKQEQEKGISEKRFGDMVEAEKTPRKTRVIVSFHDT